MKTGMRKGSRKGSQRWLLLLYALPTRRSSERVNFWRKLKKFGALQIKSSAYVLPDEPAQHERFQWLSKQIRDGGGEATLIRLTEIEGMPSEKIVSAFNDLREKEYRKLSRELAAFVRKNKPNVGAKHSVSLDRFQSQFRELQEIDYFKCPAAQNVRTLLQQAAQLPVVSMQDTRPLKPKDFFRREWITRPRPQIDRVGSAWLIRKFVDHEARFKFVDSPKNHPLAIPYDMYDVEFSHHGDDCTFETLVRRFRIEDRAVKVLAEMIHDADLEDEKFQRVECVGLDRILKGLNKQGLSNDVVLAKGFECFDALYEALQR
ncbi:MAG: chromate resistance protein [Planctomycetes bacterium]|nr:chromate resistance protein [Planctomycetota bacterium]